MADIQIYQLPPKATFDLTDTLAVDDNTASHVTGGITGQKVINRVNTDAQLGGTDQVTGLDGQLANKANIDGSNADPDSDWDINILRNAATATTADTVNSQTPTSGNVLTGDGSQWLSTPLPAVSVSLQDAYDFGSDANINMSNGRPILIKSGSDEFNINDATTNPTIFIEIKTTDRGTIFAPVMTIAQRDAIVSPPVGLWVFVSDSSPARPYVFNGGWEAVSYLSDFPTLQELGVPVGNLVTYTTDTVMTNPPNPFVVLNFPVDGIVTLPPANEATSIALGQRLFFYAFQPSAGAVTLKYPSGTTFTTVKQGMAFTLMLIDNSSTNGGWAITEYPQLFAGKILGGSTSGIPTATDLTALYSSLDFDSSTYAQIKIGANYANLIAGDNLTKTNNGDGTWTLDASSEIPEGTSDFAGQQVNANGSSSVLAVADTFYPIQVSGGTFNDEVSSNFVNEIVSISGINTPTMRYTNDGTQFFQVDWNLFARGVVASQQTYHFKLFIYKADTTIVDTGFQGECVVQDLIFPTAVPISGIVQLSTGDRLFIQAKNPSNAQNILVQFYNATAISMNGAAMSNSGTYTPTFTIGAGASSTTLISAMYQKLGNIVTASVKFLATATDGNIAISMTLPIASTFTTATQAALMGQSLSTSSPAIGDGYVSSLVSNSSTNEVDLQAVCSVGSGSKTIYVSFMYEVL